MEMTTVEAIKHVFSPVTTKEIMELRKSMHKDAWDDFGKECAKFAGATWKASA